MNSSDPASPNDAAPDSVRRESALAVRNAVTLGFSLVLTWSVALLVRIYLPYRVGPEVFGIYDFAESFAIGATAILNFGIDTYIQKEVAIRPAHASEFFGSVNALRFLLSPLLIALCYLILLLLGRPPEAREVALLYCVAQIVVISSNNAAALIQASSKVGGLAAINVAVKILWGGAAFAILIAGKGILAVTAILLATELIRGSALFYLAKKHVGVVLRFDTKILPAVLMACLPLALTQFGASVYGSISRVVLMKMAGDTEVGWYGAASNLAKLALFLSPLINAALLPPLSRAAARSEKDLLTMLSQSIEVVFMIALPIGLVMGLGADLWAPKIFGASFAPSALSIRSMAALFILTYISMLFATGLYEYGRTWWIAGATLIGITANPLLGYLLLPPFARHFGPGGAAFGIGISVVLTELIIIAFYAVRFPKFPVNRASALRMLKALLAALLIILLHTQIAFLGIAAMGVELALYCALAVLSGAVVPREMLSLAKLALKREPAKQAEKQP